METLTACTLFRPVPHPVSPGVSARPGPLSETVWGFKVVTQILKRDGGIVFVCGSQQASVSAGGGWEPRETI